MHLLEITTYVFLLCAGAENSSKIFTAPAIAKIAAKMQTLHTKSLGL
jgi:hypothetical protein